MIVPFMDARPTEESFVYRCLPEDEYGWVTDPEYWDDIDEPVKVKRQQWRLICEEEVIFHPRHELCPRCGGEGVVDAPASELTDVPCPFCGGDGGHPSAGQMEVLSIPE